MTIGTTGGGTNWPGGSFDPETNIAYLFAGNSGVAPLGLIEPPPGFSDIRYVSGVAGQPFRVSEGPGFGSAADFPQPPRGRGEQSAANQPPAARRGEGAQAPTQRASAAPGGSRGGTTVQGLPIVKPPYSLISAISLANGDILWQSPHGDTPDVVRNHPALKGLNIPKTGQPGYSIGTLVTKTLVIAGDAQVTTTETHPRGAMLRAYDKATGREVGAVWMPAPQSGTPMTYSVNGKQYIVVAVSGGNYSGEYLAFSVPTTGTTTTSMNGRQQQQ
jgi:quinoprotein glucose dehydrogenase